MFLSFYPQQMWCDQLAEGKEEIISKKKTWGLFGFGFLVNLYAKNVQKAVSNTAYGTLEDVWNCGCM